MMQVRILKPTKSAMQSGAGDEKWSLTFVTPDNSVFREELMARTSSKDMMSSEVTLEFPTLEEARKFAEAKNYDYEIIHPKKRKIKKKSYADNFL